jgi:UDP-N-acetylmuramoyl-tripeptide--D-alanyl-D-alanine ligase
MRLSEIAKILNAPLIGDDAEIGSISIDTRDLVPGQLFLAIKGEQFDGHDFLATAVEKNAGGAVVSTPHKLPIPTIQVADTRIALGKLAAYHRDKFQIPVIGITGSCGKTTTKSMLASVLCRMGSTLSPERSFNNDVGVPLTLLKLNPNYKYVVAEMGANHPGEIAYLSGIAKQNVAVITNVALAHLAGFGTEEGVATAKGEIYQRLSGTDIAIINNDDKYADFWLKNLKTKHVITFGIKKPADVMATNIRLDDEGKPLFDVTYPDGTLKIHLSVLGLHNVMNALATIAAAYAVGANSQAIEQGLGKVAAVSKRLVRYKGQAGSLIIDDTYNANPLSVSAALEMLTHGSGEKIFVFGDMAELGSEEKQLHVEVGKNARRLGINKLYACGKLTQFTVDAFGENGFYYQDQASLISALKPTLHSNAVVLIKGSRSSRMENVVQALIQEI